MLLLHSMYAARAALPSASYCAALRYYAALWFIAQTPFLLSPCGVLAFIPCDACEIEPDAKPASRLLN